MIIITGASDNHFLTLCNFIQSYIKYCSNNKLIVYDLGLSVENVLKLELIYKTNHKIK